MSMWIKKEKEEIHLTAGGSDRCGEEIASIERFGAAFGKPAPGSLCAYRTVVAGVHPSGELIFLIRLILRESIHVSQKMAINSESLRGTLPSNFILQTKPHRELDRFTIFR
jgi:hypothetical protein